jgi:hypothetical protein
MHVFRLHIVNRLTSMIVVVGMLSFLFAPVSRAANDGNLYGDWVRSQAGSDVSDAFEKALQHAEESGAGTLGAFLNAFVEEFQQVAPGERLADYFGAGSDLALIPYLQSRFMQLVGDAVLPRVLFVAAGNTSSHQDSRAGQGLTSRAFGSIAADVAGTGIASGSQVDHPVALRLLCAERPQGP